MPFLLPAFSKALITFTIFRAAGHFSTQRPQPTQEYMPSLFAGKYTSLCIKRWRNLCIWLVRLLPCAIMVKSEYMQESQQRIPLYAMSCIIIFDIIALAGRTYKGAGTTSQTRFVQAPPTAENRISSLLHFHPSLPRRDGCMEASLRSHGSLSCFFRKFLLVFCIMHPSRSSLTDFPSMSVPSQSGLSSTVLLLSNQAATSAAGSAQSIPNTLQKQDFPPAHDRPSPPWFHALFLLHKKLSTGSARNTLSSTFTPCTSQAFMPNTTNLLLF